MNARSSTYKNGKAIYGYLNPLASCNTNGLYCVLEWAAAIQTVCIVGLTQISQGFAIKKKFIQISPAPLQTIVRCYIGVSDANTIEDCQQPTFTELVIPEVGEKWSNLVWFNVTIFKETAKCSKAALQDMATVPTVLATTVPWWPGRLGAMIPVIRTP